METQTNKFPPVLIWTAGIAIILFCAAGIAAIMGWIPNSKGLQSDNAAPISLEKSQPEVPKPTKAKVQSDSQSRVAANTQPARVKCAECATIVSTREVETKGEGTGLGAVGGAVVGGLIGNQVGGGRGKDVATVVGAVGGVIAGNEVEKRARSTKSYAVTVRMNDGSSRVIHMAKAPTWRNGDNVKIVDGAIHSN